MHVWQEPKAIKQPPARKFGIFDLIFSSWNSKSQDFTKVRNSTGSSDAAMQDFSFKTLSRINEDVDMINMIKIK